MPTQRGPGKLEEENRESGKGTLERLEGLDSAVVVVPSSLAGCSCTIGIRRGDPWKVGGVRPQLYCTVLAGSSCAVGIRSKDPW